MLKLYRHQTEALEKTADLNRVAYFLDMGLGKTYVGSEKMKSMGAGVNLIICQKSKVTDWVKHFKEYYTVFVYDMTNKKDFENFFKHADLFSPRVAVINYELAWRRKDLLNLEEFTLMLDESSLIQNSKAKQSKFIMKLKPKNVILLSGTPCSGKYENLLTQVHLLGWNISEQLYNRQYVKFKKVESDGFIHNVIDGYQNVERLKSKLREHGCVFMKTEEVFDLPEQTFIPIKVPTSREYRKFMKNDYVKFKDGTEFIGDMAFKKHLISRQLCGIYSAAKLEAFQDLIQSTSDRLIVFYNFKDEVKQLIEITEKNNKPWSIVCGDQKNLEVYENYCDSITFVQYQAGAMGLNLQKSNKIVYFTLPERTDLFEQSKKRIHRIGQDKVCFYYLMMCEKSVEDWIYEALQQKKDYTDELFIERSCKND